MPQITAYNQLYFLLAGSICNWQRHLRTQGRVRGTFIKQLHLFVRHGRNTDIPPSRALVREVKNYASSTKFKWAAKNSVTKIDNILMQYFLK